MTSISVARRKLKELGWAPGRFLSCMPAPGPWASTAGVLHTPSIWQNMARRDMPEMACAERAIRTVGRHCGGFAGLCRALLRFVLLWGQFATDIPRARL